MQSFSVCMGGKGYTRGPYSQVNAQHFVLHLEGNQISLSGELRSYSATYLHMDNSKKMAFFMIPYKQTLCDVHILKCNVLHMLALFKGCLDI
jgi:hypothetical protein